MTDPEFAPAQNARSCAPCGCMVTFDGRFHIDRACSLEHRIWIMQKMSDAGWLFT